MTPKSFGIYKIFQSSLPFSTSSLKHPTYRLLPGLYTFLSLIFSGYKNEEHNQVIFQSLPTVMYEVLASRDPTASHAESTRPASPC